MDFIEVINKKGMLSVTEAAIYTGLKKQYIYKMVHYKKIRYFKPTPGKLYFAREDLDSWMRQGCVEPVANEEVKDTEKEYQPINFFDYV